MDFRNKLAAWVQRGPQRREALENAFAAIGDKAGYYLGPHVTGAATNALNVFNAISPGADVRDAYEASGDLMDWRGPMDAATDAATLGAAFGSMLLPGGVSSYKQGFDDLADELARGYDPSRVNIFAGMNAKTADLGALDRAQRMDAAGSGRDAIWNETGWFKGTDGQWRFEVDDSGVRLRTAEETSAMARGMRDEAKAITDGIKERNAFAKIQPDLFPGDVRRNNGELRRKAEALRADARGNFGPEWDHATNGQRAQYAVAGGLEAAYPDMMRGTIVRTDQGGDVGAYGSYNYGRDAINVFRSAPDERSTLLHELQHAVQEQENFASGANPAIAANLAQRDMWERASKEIRRLDALVDSLPPEYKRQWDLYIESGGSESVNLAERMMKNDVLAPVIQQKRIVRERLEAAGAAPDADVIMDTYRRFAGETEARNVQARRDFSAQDRRHLPPWDTEDVAPGQQIVRSR